MAEAWTRGQWAKGVVHWRKGSTAYMSIVFTWDLPKARKIAEYYRMINCRVIAGGPALLTRRDYLADLCEIPMKKVVRDYGVIEVPADLEGEDAVTRHNPMATFASRGCSEKCSFCIVPRLEGGLASFHRGP